MATGSVGKKRQIKNLLNAIEAESQRVEKNDFSRFGYLSVHDVEILIKNPGRGTPLRGCLQVLD